MEPKLTQLGPKAIPQLLSGHSRDTIDGIRLNAEASKERSNTGVLTCVCVERASPVHPGSSCN